MLYRTYADAAECHRRTDLKPGYRTMEKCHGPEPGREQVGAAKKQNGDDNKCQGASEQIRLQRLA